MGPNAEKAFGSDKGVFLLCFRRYVCGRRLEAEPRFLSVVQCLNRESCL